MDDELYPKSGAARRRHGLSRRSFLKWSGATGATTTALMAAAPEFAQANLISAENQQVASDANWESDRDDDIVGFTTQYSVQPGDTVDFKIKTAASSYKIRLYRLGYYGGVGARFLSEVAPSATLPQSQPAPLTEPSTGLVDCGNWATSASWTVPSTALSGVYYAKFVPTGSSASSIGTNHTIFVVRSNRASDVLVQTSEMTMHAYNRYGGNSLYYGEPVGRALKVSYNRPFGEGIGNENDFFNAEYALIRFLERNGYDVSYCGGIDVHRSASIVTGHKVFISSGHDEYVSGPQRQHVESARDAGTHLIFMTGNEYFWRVRLAPSLDTAATADRTIVCYKETLDNARTDPSAEWTGTWRDPRFCPPASGGARPENALTGQLFSAILPVNNPDKQITVPATFAKLRFWRHTAVAQLTAGQTRTLAANTLGYEFDSDTDNGARPAGLIRLSSTMTTAPQVLQDFGGTYAAGAVEHAMTMYRAASGALVWGTGTVQWAYGLDATHVDDEPGAVDPVIQQATVNALADMGVQPASLIPGLVPATKSADATPPTVTITAPTASATITIGTPVTVTGTALDSGGGVVAAVEVSTDGCASWHPATGTSSWSYVFTPTTTGPIAISARGIDDSCNIGVPETTSVTAGERALPCSIWPAQVAVPTPSTTDATPIEAGVRFRADRDGFISGVRFFKGATNTGTHVGSLWTADGVRLATATFDNESATGWQSVSFAPIAIAAGAAYVASVWMPNGHYAAEPGYFSDAYDLAPLRALANGEAGANGLFRAGSSGFPLSSYGASNYWVDVVFDIDNHAAPLVVNHSPAHDLVSVATSSTVSVTFSEAMTPGSITVSLASPAGPVTGATSYDSATRTATFTPSSALQRGTEYTLTAHGTDLGGVPMAAAFTSAFTTVMPDGETPATLWDTSATPAQIEAHDTSAVELGLKFTSSIDGQVSAIRFYKSPQSTGTHVAHLWSAAGTLLATTTFTSETASGWQQASLSTPVAITKNTTYVVSYFAPNGGYAATVGGLTSARTRPPLQAPASSAVGGNGVYKYGASSFPATASAGANYWVDVVVTRPADTNPLTLVASTPAADAYAITTSSVIEATFARGVVPASLTMTVTGPGGAAVAGETSYDASSTTGRFTPAAALTAGTVYLVRVTASDTGSSVLPPTSWSFTTEAVPGLTPATLWNSDAAPSNPAASDPNSVELGVRFRASAAGSILGVRFYKGAANTGTHLGRVWTSTGELLASAAFSAESATGWQQVLFSQPVPITAETEYVASYFAPSGRYASTPAGLASGHTRAPLTAPASTASAPNGLYAYGSGGFPSNSYNASNYWVDVIFADTSGPSVTEVSPAAGSSSCAPTAAVTVSLSEPIAAGSAVVRLRDGAGSQVGGALSYSSDGQQVTFTPAAALTPLATYTASIEAATDMPGNALTDPVSWSFTVAGASVHSLWSNAEVPAVVDVNDSDSVELGVKFRATRAGSIAGVRFYRGGTTNAAPHRVSLWTSTGTLLATATSTQETARGWQSVYFATPVPVSADVTYVASYFASSGHYSTTGGYFHAGSISNGPLVALGNGVDGGNGLYGYGPDSAFPAHTYGAANYWVDVLLTN